MDLTRDRMVRFVGRAWDQVKSPLYRNAFFIEQFDCGNAVVAHAISRHGFDYRAR